MIKESNNIFEKLYKMQEEELDKFLMEEIKEIKKKLNYIDDEEIKKEEKYSKIIEKIEDNYQKEIAYLNEKFYKKGFSDGVKFILYCIKN